MNIKIQNQALGYNKNHVVIEKRGSELFTFSVKQIIVHGVANEREKRGNKKKT